jgi:hypothetical protein
MQKTIVIPKIYLETTMFSYYHEERPQVEYQELKAQVRRIFDRIKTEEYEPYTSVLSTTEIDAEPNAEKRERMKAIILDYGITFLEVTPEVERLATLYILEGAVPQSYEIDAAHIAITTVNGLDFIVSLNFGHIARPWTVERVRRVNKREGYQGIGIYKPLEVLES